MSREGYWLSRAQQARREIQEGERRRLVPLPGRLDEESDARTGWLSVWERQITSGTVLAVIKTVKDPWRMWDLWLDIGGASEEAELNAGSARIKSQMPYCKRQRPAPEEGAPWKPSDQAYARSGYEWWVGSTARRYAHWWYEKGRDPIKDKEVEGKAYAADKQAAEQAFHEGLSIGVVEETQCDQCVPRGKMVAFADRLTLPVSMAAELHIRPAHHHDLHEVQDVASGSDEMERAWYTMCADGITGWCCVDSFTGDLQTDLETTARNRHSFFKGEYDSPEDALDDVICETGELTEYLNTMLRQQVGRDIAGAHGPSPLPDRTVQRLIERAIEMDEGYGPIEAMGFYMRYALNIALNPDGVSDYVAEQTE